MDLAAEPAARHAGHVQLLDDHHAVALGVAMRENVEDVGALAANRAVESGDAQFGPGAALRALPPTSDDALSAGKPVEAGLQMFRVGFSPFVRIGQQVRDASVDSDHRRGPRRWVWKLLLALDRHEPLVYVTANRAPLRHTLDGSMEHGPQLAEFRKHHAGRGPDGAR